MNHEDCLDFAGYKGRKVVLSWCAPHVSAPDAAGMAARASVRGALPTALGHAGGHLALNIIENH